MKITHDNLTRLQKYCDLIKRMSDADHDRTSAAMVKDMVNKDVSIFEDLRENITYSIGPKYARVYSQYPNGDNKRVHSFVNMANGDIMKGTWESPIRDKSGKLAVRGNIWADDLGESKITVFGPKYLR